LSNRKRERKSGEVKGMLAEISSLAERIEKTGCKTLGEFLHHNARAMDHANRVEDDHVRGRHTLRQMLENEFDAIWQQQSVHHPDLLTDKLRYGSAGPRKQPEHPHPRSEGSSLLELFGLQGMIFFQRPIYWPRSVVGACELEPKAKRAPRADRRAQRFRLLQEVNNLRYLDPDTREEKVLDEGQRALLLSKLSRAKEMDFDKIRKDLGFLETVRFNLEAGKRKKIQGMVSDCLLASKSAVGPNWHALPEATKNAVVALLASSTDDDETHEALVKHHKLTAEQADAALDVDLPTGYVNLSVKALENLLPHMERGLRLMGNDENDSAMHAAGYMRRDELQRRIFDHLPDPARIRAGDARIGDIPNPVVKRAIVELRKVVNAIIREHGKPDAVHVEMTRTVREGPARRSEYSSRIREIEASRDHAADEIRKLKLQGVNVHVRRDSILQYLLWQQQDHACIYCGDKISQAQLFGGEIDVDHILPYSRCLDDSQMNKVVCHRKCNADKGNRTPHEWLADSDPDRYDRVCQFALSLVRRSDFPYKKYRRLIQKELVLDDFIARQLTATGYIASATAEYLRCLFEHDHDVLGLKGELTAELRHQWGLDDLLSSLPDSPAWREQSNLRPGEKNRADHRHHVIDAIVVALTDRSRLQQLSRIRKAGGVRTTGEALEFPWRTFRDDVIEKINQIKISHRCERKVAGGLHEDTFYGATHQEGVFVVRKSLDALSPNEVPMIRDAGIRRIVENQLAKHGIGVGRGKKTDARTWRAAMTGVAMPSGVPIKRVRVLRNEKTIRPIREGRHDQAFVKPGSTHHLALFEWRNNGKRKRDAVFVTMLEAINRIKRHEPIIQRTPPINHPSIPPDAAFLFSLSRGEMVLADWKGEEKLLVFKTASSTQGQIWFAEHTDSRKSSEYKQFVANANTLNARKVTVNPLGRIRWAND